ncbi:MAG: hypothetical protein MUF06_01255 [Pirellulaceae bacterium]|jgi:hypothetical protein|nr:hypothetical protein [Pirellulaceae bacterium]
MSRSLKSLVLVLASAGVVVFPAVDAQACGGKGGGGGYRVAYRPAYNYQYNYAACPTQPRVVQQPIHQQPFPQQQFPQQGQFPQQQFPEQPGQFPQQAGQLPPQQASFAQQGVAPQGVQQPGVAPQQFGQQQVAQQQFGQQQVAGRQVSLQVSGQQSSTPAQVAAVGALNTLAPAQTAQAQPQQFAQAPAAQPSINQSSAAQPTFAQAPRQQQPVSQPQAIQAQPAPSQVAQPQAPQTVAPQATSSAAQSAQQQALNALLGVGPSEATASQSTAVVPPPAAPQVPQGDFSAALSNGARIHLNLSPSGSFVWTTTKDGKTSQFEGTFSLAGGQLQLQRADKHNLEGVFTPSDNGFNLKLQGQTDGGLNFVRV